MIEFWSHNIRAPRPFHCPFPSTNVPSFPPAHLVAALISVSQLWNFGTVTYVCLDFLRCTMRVILNSQHFPVWGRFSEIIQVICLEQHQAFSKLGKLSAPNFTMPCTEAKSPCSLVLYCVPFAHLTEACSKGSKRMNP